MKLATPSNRALTVAIAIAVVLVLLPAVLHVEPHHAWDRIPGFYGLFGALGCAVLIGVAKWLGHVLLVRPEGWYDDHGGDAANRKSVSPAAAERGRPARRATTPRRGRR